MHKIKSLGDVVMSYNVSLYDKMKTIIVPSEVTALQQ